MYYEAFQELCEINNVRPSQVSKETGISTATLSSWKKGKYTPKIDKLQKIADYFGVRLEVLCDNQDDGNAPILSVDEQTLIDSFRKLNDDGKKYLEQTITMLLQNPAFTISDAEKKEDYFIS